MDIKRLINDKEYREVEKLISHGLRFTLFDINNDDLNCFGNEISPLFEAALFGDTEIIDQFDDVNIENDKLHTPISWAVINDNAKSFYALLDKGARLDCITNQQENLIHLAVKFKSNSILNPLIDILPSELIINKNNRGFSPLLLACAVGNIYAINEIIKLIKLEDIMVKNIYNASIMHWLAYNCKKDDDIFSRIIIKILQDNWGKKKLLSELFESNAINYTPNDWLDKNNSFQTIKNIERIMS